VGRKEKSKEGSDAASLTGGRNKEIIVPIFYLTSYRR
jgi:hypothetical protein